VERRAYQIRTESAGMRLEHQPRWSPHALSNSDDATSTVSFGQAMASSNGFAVATDPTNPLTRGVALDPAIASRCGKIVQVAPFQRPRARRADGGVARRPVVHHYKLHFVTGHLTGPYLAVRLRTPVWSTQRIATCRSCAVRTFMSTMTPRWRAVGRRGFQRGG